ncbi:MAG: hypothetical protein HQK99_13170 [Nitrospirae bacterium]|nr:hypothetical protein [Nitrospirota bacterium]
MPEETLRGKYIRQVEVLSQLRDLQDEVSKEAEAMALVYDLERDVRFRQGRELGMIEGIELGLELKFGSAGLALMDMVRVVNSVDKLKEFRNLIKKSNSLDELKDFLDKSI